ncbi:MAG: hypothetical protein FWE18_04095 [Alphaproteobacteria bacterium]|nr:hypothetical protein [Alphaproteobacteria bacterium]
MNKIKFIIFALAFGLISGNAFSAEPNSAAQTKDNTKTEKKVEKKDKKAKKAKKEKKSKKEHKEAKTAEAKN